MSVDPAVLARTTARMLSLGVWFASFALALTLGALAALATSAALPMGWLFTVALGALAFFYALRARIDARLFDDLATSIASGVGEHDALRALDASLTELGLARSASATPRPLAERATSAMRLVRRAALLTGAQLALSAALWLYGQPR